MRFLEPEPWLKARIDPAALKQSDNLHQRRRKFDLVNGTGAWNAMIASGTGARERMAEADALPPEWRRYMHDYNLPATLRAMREFGARSAHRASILQGLDLKDLDL